MKLSEFHLKSYDERSALQCALQFMRSHDPDNFYKAEVSALLTRLSQTQCQPGGCEYCGGGNDE